MRLLILSTFLMLLSSFTFAYELKISASGSATACTIERAKELALLDVNNDLEEIEIKLNILDNCQRMNSQINLPTSHGNLCWGALYYVERIQTYTCL